jgi:hypothetical protein
VKCQTMEPSPSRLHAKSARYYNAVGFGIKFFLRCDIEKDFTMSIVQAHLDEIMYQNDDQIVFFFFPSNWNCGSIVTWRYSYVQSTGTTLYIFALQ